MIKKNKNKKTKLTVTLSSSPGMGFGLVTDRMLLRKFGVWGFPIWVAQASLQSYKWGRGGLRDQHTCRRAGLWLKVQRG